MLLVTLHRSKSKGNKIRKRESISPKKSFLTTENGKMDNKKLIHFQTQHILSKDQAPVVIIIATTDTRIEYTI